MEQYYVYFYLLLVVFVAIRFIFKKMKKASNNAFNQQKKPVSNYQQPKQSPPKQHNTQPKTLEDILRSLTEEVKQPAKQTPKVQEKLVGSDKQPIKSTTLKGDESLENFEKKYYAQDTELEFNNELEDYDELTDHHVHGLGFDNIKQAVEEQDNDEWENIDWRKAVITAEILRRPEY